MVLGVVCLAQLTVLLDNTVVNVAIPSLNKEMGASTADIQWMVNAYSLVQSGLLLTVGSAADRYGRKRALMAGLGVFGVGSLLASQAQSPGQLIAARAGMGVGGALLMTTTLAVVVQVFDEEERVRAIGVWATVATAGFAAGPLIGGVLLTRFWWGSIFLVNVPVAAVALVAVARLVPESKNPVGRRPDLIGALLSTIGMVGVVYAIIAGPGHGWGFGHVVVPAVVGVVALGGFVLWERTVAYPMLDMGFFRDRRFVGAVAGGVLVAFGMGGSFFLLTQHLQFVLGYGPLRAGLCTAPLAVVIAGLNLLGAGAWLLRRIGTPSIVLLGMGLLAAGLALVAVVGGYGYGPMVAGLVLMGAGIALASPAMGAALMGAIPPQRAGIAAGVNGTLTEFGSGLGIAVLGAVLGARFAALLPRSVTGTSLPAALAAAHGPGERAQVTHAFASGVSTSQLIGALAVFAGGLVSAALLRRADRHDRSATAGPGDEDRPDGGTAPVAESAV
nr:MFS transporter [Streptomyces sp. SID5468]